MDLLSVKQRTKKGKAYSILMFRIPDSDADIFYYQELLGKVGIITEFGGQYVCDLEIECSRNKVKEVYKRLGYKEK